LLAVGSAAGLILGLLASRVLVLIVYQATPRDPLVLAGVVLAMLLLGLYATWMPAQRELRVRYRNRILAIAEKRGAHNVRVFGSIARGQPHSTSDVDFLVDFEPGGSLLDLTGLWLDLEDALGYKIDVVSSRGLRPRLATEVMRDVAAL